jgi:diguanylate cyclase (GGDEF)-like protein
MYIDLDGFKPVNDSHGHAAGDTVLVEVARRLVETAGVHDLVARLGGDEFAILSRDTSPEQAAELGDRVVAMIQKPIDLEGELVVIGASIGIAVGDPVERAGFAARADEALYRAKASGGRCVVTLPI